MKTYPFIIRSILSGMFLILLLSPTATVAEDKGGPGFYPIYDVSQGCILGAWTSDGWLHYDSAATMIRGGEEYTYYNMYKSLGNAIGSPSMNSEMGACPELFYIEMSDSIENAEHVIAVAAPWNALPRFPRKIKPNSAVKAILSGYLKANGISKPKLTVKQAFIVDLDGSGIMDTVIAATYYKGEFWSPPKSGFYSVILVRRSVGGASITIPVIADVYSKNIEEYSLMYENYILGFFDLNNDGRLEILVSVDYYEGSTAALMQLIGGEFIPMLDCGCGV